MSCIRDRVPEKYRKYIDLALNIFLLLFFFGMSWVCTHTGCYQIIDQHGNPYPQEELIRIVDQCLASRNKAFTMNFTIPDNITTGTTLPPNQNCDCANQ